MIWTHIYDLILKFLTMFLIAAILTKVPVLEDRGVLTIILILAIAILSYHYYIRTFSTYLYCRLSLKMNINISQAKLLNDAYCPTFSLKWLPMRELKNLDNDLKYETALRILDSWKEEKKKSKE